MRQNGRIYSWILVALLWGVALLNYMDRQMLATMQNAIRQDIVELNKAEAFGALMAVFLWIYGIVSPFAGVVADRFSRKWLIVGSLFVWSLVTYLMGYTTTFRQLYVLRAIMGVSEALYIPSALSLITDWHIGKSRSLAVGIHNTGLYMGQAIGGFGATIAMLLSWKQTFHGFGCIGMIYSLVLIMFLHESPRREILRASVANDEVAGKPLMAVFKGISILLGNISFWVMLFYFAAPSLPGWATKNWLPTLFVERLNVPMTSAGPMATMTIAVASFVGVIIGGTLSDRWVKSNSRARVYTSTMGLSLTIPALVIMGFGGGCVSIVGSSVLFGIGFGMFDANNMPILCQIIPESSRSTAYGLMNTVGVFAGAMITQVLGKWGDQGRLGIGFGLLGIVVALAVVLQLVFVRPTSDNME